MDIFLIIYWIFLIIVFVSGILLLLWSVRFFLSGDKETKKSIDKETKKSFDMSKKLKKKYPKDSLQLVEVIGLIAVLNALASSLAVFFPSLIPYEYWTLTRFLTTFGALYCLYVESQLSKPSDLRFVFILVAVLFNPFFIIELSAWIWAVIHIMFWAFIQDCFQLDD